MVPGDPWVVTGITGGINPLYVVDIPPRHAAASAGIYAQTHQLVRSVASLLFSHTFHSSISAISLPSHHHLSAPEPIRFSPVA